MTIFRLKLTKPLAALLIVLVALSGAAAAAVAVLLPPSYETSSAIVLVGPTRDQDGKPSNPFLNYTPALGVTADLLVLSSLRTATVKQVVKDGGASGYEVVSSTSSSEPIITVTGIARTKAQAVKTTNLVVTSIKADLASQQTGQTVNKTLLISIVTLSEPGKVDRQWKKAIELSAATLAAGLTVSLLIVVLIDRRRRTRRASVVISDPGDGDTPPATTDRGPRPSPYQRRERVKLRTRPRPESPDTANKAVHTYGDDDAPNQTGSILDTPPKHNGSPSQSHDPLWTGLELPVRNKTD